MISTSLPTEYRGGVNTGPTTPGGDGIIASGPGHVTVISDKVFDWRDVPTSQQDEVISSKNGANVRIQRCLIIGGIKALLAGNGDHPGNDARYARWDLEDCVIMDAGRRCPEVQDGVELTMRRCWVHNWGRRFDVRAFAGWAHRGGKIVAEDCLFTQEDGLFSLGLRDTMIDLANHVGQAINDQGLAALLRLRTYLPGVCRALTSDTGGLALATRCYRNRSWIQLENCDPYLSRAEAIKIAERIDAAMPSQAHARLGVSVLELFYSAT